MVLVSNFEAHFLYILESQMRGMGRICIASNKGWGWIIAICKVIVFKHGVQKYVQGKPTVYEVCAIIEVNTSSKMGIFCKENL